MQSAAIPSSITAFIERICELCGTEHASWATIFSNAFSNTLEHAIHRHNDGSTFVLTGDIPAMWLRDSTAQIRPYLIAANEDEKIFDMIAGLVRQQFVYINMDPYANAFNEQMNYAGHQDDETKMSGWVWERKYEIDSLCYPVQLAYLLYRNTGKIEHFDDCFTAGIRTILQIFEIEQKHASSTYSFIRHTERSKDTLSHNGQGSHVEYTGMTWSGFRPSDDSCTYGYLIPANMFAVVILGYIEQIFTTIIPDEDIAAKASKLKQEISLGIEHFGKISNASGKIMYAYEVDGAGNALLMDDANIPSLLSAPYIGFVSGEDKIYQETRRTILSKENPYYFSGTYASGIGSSHTPEDSVWPISLAMEGLTARTKTDKAAVLDLLAHTDAETSLMHESFNVNNVQDYTRPWFSWANMMFCELVMDYFDIRIAQ
ncbi:glycoside hydrolase family 125 protein [Bifidobacterium aquikefiri]|uniref:glycoside hydrolase family 125 protein n=1 Tax=Bifidobacterium aquikefiri TaxID=1653207 RepID=UPI0039E9A674